MVQPTDRWKDRMVIQRSFFTQLVTTEVGPP